MPIVKGGSYYEAIERAENTQRWTGFTQMGGTVDYALRLINTGSSDATVGISPTFFSLLSFGGLPFACGIGVLLSVAGTVAVVVGLVRKTDGRPIEPTVGES